MSGSARLVSSDPEESYWHVNTMTVVIVLLVHATITTRIAEDVRTLTRLLLFAAIVLVPLWPRSWTLWAVLTAILGFEIVRAPLDLPNHHYALTYVTLATALALWAGPEVRGANLRTSARWIVVAIMGLATLQKTTSPEFTSGAYVGYMLATGGFAGPLVGLCEACRAAVDANLVAVQEFRSVAPALAGSLTLASPIPDLAIAAKVFGWSILAYEAWLAIAFAVAPHRRWGHWSLLAFAATLGVLRQEFLFIGVVCALGLLSCRRELIWERRAYALAAIVFAAGAIS